MTSGAIIWTLGLGLQILRTPETSIGEVIGFLELNAIGIGFNLQTTLVAALATTKNEDRAVVTGGRNYFRKPTHPSTTQSNRDPPIFEAIAKHTYHLL